MVAMEVIITFGRGFSLVACFLICQGVLEVMSWKTRNRILCALQVWMPWTVFLSIRVIIEGFVSTSTEVASHFQKHCA